MNLLELKSNLDFPGEKLSDSTIHLWIARDNQIRCEVSIEQCLTTISENELETRHRLHFDDHKHQYVVTRTLVRDVLSRYRPEVPAEDWVFEKNQYGRPYISRHQCNDDLYFNISHTQGFVVLAVANHYQVGIDVERFNEQIEFKSIAERFFFRMNLKPC